MTYSTCYTKDRPRKSGFYWIVDDNYPVAQVFYVMNSGNRGWCVYGPGGASHGWEWTDRMHRSLEPLVAPLFVFESTLVNRAMLFDEGKNHG